MEWISSIEELPENGETCLIYIISYNEPVIEVARMIDDSGNGIIWFYPENNGYTKSEVTHWMPLPNPPAPESVKWFEMTPLQVSEMKDKYEKLLAFAKEASKQSCCYACECISCMAIEVLREIEESK